jgi:hypothetical protein
MTFFVRITPKSEAERLSGELYGFDLSEPKLWQQVVEPYEQGESITLHGRSLRGDDISAIRITEVEDVVAGVPFAQLRSNWGLGRRQEVGEFIAERGRDVTDRFISGPPGGAKPQRHSSPPQPSSVGSTAQPSRPPSRVAAIYLTASVVALAIGIAPAPPYQLAAAIAAVIGVAILHPWLWRRSSRTWAVAALVIAALVAGLGAHIVFEGDSADDSSDSPVNNAQTTSQREAVGQIEGGNIVRVGRGGSFADPVEAPANAELLIAIRISNAGPDDLDLIETTAILPEYAAELISLEIAVDEGMGVRAPVADAATIEVKGGAACATYVEDSTSLLSTNWGLLRRLPNGIASDSGIVAGPGAAPVAQTRFIAFSIRLVRLPPGTPCPA